MELWIRSQDKMELVKIEEICISIDNDRFIGVWSYGSNKDLKYYLGTYKTRERALEILDEIQKFILDGCKEERYWTDGGWKRQGIEVTYKVYEMPKE